MVIYKSFCKKRYLFPNQQITKYSAYTLIFADIQMNLICDHCPEAFLSYRQLQFHKTKFHRPEEPNTCHLCKRTFHKIADLTQHLRVHSQPKRGSRTGGAGKKAYSCSHCCKDFAKESTFSQHLQACRQISRLLVAPREWNAAV